MPEISLDESNSYAAIHVSAGLNLSVSVWDSTPELVDAGGKLSKPLWQWQGDFTLFGVAPVPGKTEGDITDQSSPAPAPQNFYRQLAAASLDGYTQVGSLDSVSPVDRSVQGLATSLTVSSNSPSLAAGAHLLEVVLVATDGAELPVAEIDLSQYALNPNGGGGYSSDPQDIELTFPTDSMSYDDVYTVSFRLYKQNTASDERVSVHIQTGEAIYYEPQITVLAPQPATPGQSLDFGANATAGSLAVTIENNGDADLNVMSVSLTGSGYQLVNLPAGPGLIAPGCQVEFEIVEDPNQRIGPASLQIANDDSTAGAFSIDLLHAPSIISGSSVTYTVGDGGAFPVVATGAPTPTLAESGDLPAGVTFDPTTGILTVSPAAGPATAVIEFTADNGIGQPATQSFTLNLVAASVLTPAGVTIHSTEGATFSGAVATFTDSNPNGALGDFSALIDWGDGSSATAGTISAGSGGGFVVSGSHAYAHEGTTSVTVTISDVGGSTATAQSTAQIADAPLSATGMTITSTEGATFSGAVAAFTDANPNGALGDYSALIDWGDGSSATAGTISAGSGGSFVVSGSHAYSEQGMMPVTVTISDIGGSTATAQSTAEIADAPLTATGMTITTTEGVTFSGAVASFTDANPNGRWAIIRRSSTGATALRRPLARSRQARAADLWSAARTLTPRRERRPSRLRSPTSAAARPRRRARLKLPTLRCPQRA